MKKAFTLIEVLIFISIFSFVVVSFITIFIAVITLQVNQSASAEVGQQSGFLLQQIQYYIEAARLVDMTQDATSSALTLRESNLAQDPTTISLAGGIVYLQQGANGTSLALSSPEVTVSNLSFTRHYNLNTSSSPFGADSVSFSFTMSATSTNNKAYSQSFQSSAATFAPVGKIAMIQQASTTSNNPSVTSLNVAYPTSNETGSLLLAVVANTTSTATVSISDSASNTWTQIASTSYPAFKTKLTVFEALNAQNSYNAVTSTFTGGAGIASLFVYEYRGVSTSSSFDASSTQLQPNNANPSSGSANPTSTVELIFGATYNGSASDTPTPGTGFTLETSSGVTHLFVEDMVQYVTGPVAATWQYADTPSSSALVMTFK